MNLSDASIQAEIWGIYGLAPYRISGYIWQCSDVFEFLILGNMGIADLVSILYLIYKLRYEVVPVW